MRSTISASALLATLICTALSGCTTRALFTSGSNDMQEIVSENSGVQTSKGKRFLGVFTPYRIDVQQGNFVS
ncbi:MAG: hypothetical protein K0S28_2388, partial [Paucimonas sp.]|nr:hypothetical protein [Paucimonas sp.]